MGQKKRQNHATQSFGSMVSRAALSQMGPDIEKKIDDLGKKLEAKQLDELENLYVRTLVLEKIVIEKLGLSADDLTNKFADMEDERDGVQKVEELQVGDQARLEIKTKLKEQTEFQGSSRLLVRNAGSGNTIGKDIEDQIIGMKTNEVKVVEFGQNKELLAEIKLSRSSRPIKKEVATPEATT